MMREYDILKWNERKSKSTKNRSELMRNITDSIKNKLREIAEGEDNRKNSWDELDAFFLEAVRG